MIGGHLGSWVALRLGLADRVRAGAHRGGRGRGHLGHLPGPTVGRLLRAGGGARRFRWAGLRRAHPAGRGSLGGDDVPADRHASRIRYPARCRPLGPEPAPVPAAGGRHGPRRHRLCAPFPLSKRVWSGVAMPAWARMALAGAIVGVVAIALPGVTGSGTATMKELFGGATIPVYTFGFAKVGLVSSRAGSARRRPRHPTRQVRDCKSGMLPTRPAPGARTSGIVERPGSGVVGNARALGARDRGFESHLPDHPGFS